VASSQLELNKSVSLKNFLILISSFVFSILIEIFIRNQESSLKIFLDNVASYKTTFKLKNAGIETKAMKSLQGIIATSFRAIDDELNNQQNRLRYVRYINWGMSLFLVVIVIGLYFYYKTATSLSVITLLLIFFLSRHC
jgi:FMN-dependent NADH-azoreductase